MCLTALVDVACFGYTILSVLSYIFFSLCLFVLFLVLLIDTYVFHDIYRYLYRILQSTLGYSCIISIFWFLSAFHVILLVCLENAIHFFSRFLFFGKKYSLHFVKCFYCVCVCAVDECVCVYVSLSEYCLCAGV